MRALKTVALDGIDRGVALFRQVDAEIAARLGQRVWLAVAREGNQVDDNLCGWRGEYEWNGESSGSVSVGTAFRRCQ